MLTSRKDSCQCRSTCPGSCNIKLKQRKVKMVKNYGTGYVQ
nr:MAG TPA: metallothionein [Bacteriophage sp.]